MIPSGWVVSVPIILPNVLWALLPGPAGQSSAKAPATALLRVVSFVEGAGRVAVLVLPFFLDWQVQTVIDRVVACVGGLALALYYAGWGRYFLGGRAPALLFAALGPLAVPLAVAPVTYFLAFAVLARSSTMAVVTVLFGAAHVFMSIRRAGSA